MRRLILFLVLALAAAHAAAMSASSPTARDDGPREQLLQRIERGEADRYRAAYLLGGLELRAPDADYERAMRHLEVAARGGHLPALWLLAKRRLLGGMLGPFDIERDRETACAFLARIVAAGDFELDPDVPPARAMVDYGVSLEAARTIRLGAQRLAAKHCRPGETEIALGAAAAFGRP